MTKAIYGTKYLRGLPASEGGPGPSGWGAWQQAAGSRQGTEAVTRADILLHKQETEKGFLVIACLETSRPTPSNRHTS